MIAFRRFLLHGALLASAFASRAALADELLTLSGRWAASALTSNWHVGDWGDACGPKPNIGGGAGAGTVTITQSGSELTIAGAGRTYSTTECWEQYPGLARVSHSGGKRGWRTTCKTSSGDPRQASVTTTVTASDSYITLDEAGQYQFVVKGQNCTASVRRSRSFRLLQREGEAPPAPAPSLAEPAPKPEPRPEPAQPCATPGPPARLEIRPARKLMRPGERFVFRARVLDARGCAAQLAPTFRLESPVRGVTVSSAGVVQLGAEAAEGELPIVVTAADRSVKVTVDVVSSERYASLLETRGFTNEGESNEAVVTTIASSAVGARSVVAEDRAQSRRTRFVAIVGALALLLGLLGLVLVLRSRQKKRTAEQVEPAPGPRAPLTAPRRPLGTFCPTCREEYPSDAQFCPLDGNRLVAAESDGEPRGPAGGVCPVCGQGFDPGVTSCPKHEEDLVPVAVYRAELARTAELARICPVCGTQYPGDGRFCGKDGAALVPMN